MIINHTQKDLNNLERLITKNDGSPLQGEIDMYRRIVQDCEKSTIEWHFWHDINLPISAGNAGAIQIDFLLISEFGVIIIEVKGGAIQIEAGEYFYQNKGNLTQMEMSPFDQARKYQWALIDNCIVNGEEIFVDFVCAFPHAHIEHTNNVPAADLSYKMWNNKKHDSDCSFADFCINVIKEDKRRGRWDPEQILPHNVIENAINNFSPTCKDSGRYNQSSLKEILKWLHIENIDTLESLKKNRRIIIEGGPGTGKTTIAKAFIKKHKGLHGLYLCWTTLLASKMRNDLLLEGLDNCEVESYNSYVRRISNGKLSIGQLSASTSVIEQDTMLVQYMNGHIYDYVIIDEAQDVADKGMSTLLKELTSQQHTGLLTGRFLVLYDIEQGYNSGSRNLEMAIDEIARASAHFTINGNKRVPTNKEIVKYANDILRLKPDELDSFWDKIVEEENGYKINKYDDTRILSRAIKQKRKEMLSSGLSFPKVTILVHSDLTNPIHNELDSVFDRLSFSDFFQEITVENISNLPELSIGYTSILKYKGLENENIILIIPSKPQKSSLANFLFEIYVGMTRAIMNLDICIIKI